MSPLSFTLLTFSFSYLYAANGTAPPNVNGTIWKLVNELRSDSGNATEFDLQMVKRLSFISPKNKTENKMWKGFDSDLTEYEEEEMIREKRKRKRRREEEEREKGGAKEEEKRERKEERKTKKREEKEQ